MMTKRSFFRRFGAIIAAVALAPEIAFGVKLPVQPLPVQPTLNLEQIMRAVYDLVRARGNVVGQYDLYVDRHSKEHLDALYRQPISSQFFGL